ncbi:MAG: 4-hydroxyphenylpyruvate dioxygenase [Phycisphaeraceae bacterium]|nr:4-hydroxyphenylpyruvate dioxygenase [Phycisphaeraceae bacterium]
MTPPTSSATPSTPTRPAAAAGKSTDPLQLIDVDHVRFYCGNAKQAAYFYAHCFGFTCEQVNDQTTGSRDSAHYYLTQGNIRFVLTSGLTKDHPASRHVALYGDGVKDVAFTVHDAAAAYHQALKNGGESAQEPTELPSKDGTIVTAAIKTYGEVIHTFVQRPNSGRLSLPAVKQAHGTGDGQFMPGFAQTRLFKNLNDYNAKSPCGLKFTDHLVGNVELGKMNYWVKFYEDVLGFKMFMSFDDKDISTDFSALMSKVMASGSGLIKMPINEPAPGKKKSQVQEYLDWHNNTPGVQHLALRTDDELHSIAALRARGVDFLAIPDTYYDQVWNRIEPLLKQAGKSVKEDHQKVRDLGILVDADDEGYLLQLFTKPLQDRPTLFFEIICRRGSQAFGKGNFKALFEALELEQERRGNL